MEQEPLTLYDYVRLSKDERAALLWQEGVFLHAVDGPRGRSAFYAIGNFWAEVLIDKGSDTIIEVVPFRTGDRMEAMLSVVPDPL